MSARTIGHVRETLRSALSDALKWGLVARNVATLVDPARATRHELRPLGLDEAKAFLTASQSHRLHALYSVVLAVGLRQGEALGLHWDDVDLERGQIRVGQASSEFAASSPTLSPRATAAGAQWPFLPQSCPP